MFSSILRKRDIKNDNKNHTNTKINRIGIGIIISSIYFHTYNIFALFELLDQIVKLLYYTFKYLVLYIC